jgi:uncharacterized damage-inducible protein DinB
MRTVSILMALALCSSQALAQTTESNPYVKGVHKQFQQVQDIVMKTAEKIGEDLYSFKPTPEVRSVAGVLGHIADGNRLLCRIAAGETIDFEKIMKDESSEQQRHEKMTAKADIIKALTETRSFCDSVFAKLTDASGQELVPWFGGEKMPKLMALTLVTGHGLEHYGNLVTYMRLKGIVPPTSERPSSGQ